MYKDWGACVNECVCGRVSEREKKRVVYWRGKRKDRELIMTKDSPKIFGLTVLDRRHVAFLHFKWGNIKNKETDM